MQIMHLSDFVVWSTYGWRLNASQVADAQQNYDLAKKDFEVHKIKFDKKASNFLG